MRKLLLEYSIWILFFISHILHKFDLTEYNLLQDFRILPILVLSESTNRAKEISTKEIGTKIHEGQKFSS